MLSAWFDSTFLAMRNRNYRTLWIGTAISFLAFAMLSVVQSIVAFDLTGKNGAVGFVALGMGVATIVVSPFGGVVADRVSKRKLLLAGQSVIGISFFAVGVLIVTGQITILLLAASTFVLGIAFSFIAPGRQAWIGELVGPDEIPNAIALQQLGMTVTRIGGPFVAAGLIALHFSGTGGTYLFMGGLFAIVVATLARLPAPRIPENANGSTVLGDLKQGIGHVGDRPRLLLLSISFTGVVIGGFSYHVVLPGLLEHELGRDPRDLGLLLGVGAVSGLVVTLAVAGLSSSRHAWGLMHFGGLLLGASLLLLSMAGGIGPALGAMFLVGAGSSAFQLLNNSLVMQESDPAFFGRVMSLTMFAWGMNALAGFPFGLIADATNERWALALMGLIVCSVSATSALVYRKIGSQPTSISPVEVPISGG